MQICRNCRYFPCMKVCCGIDEEGCNDFESNVQAEIKEIDKKVKEE